MQQEKLIAVYSYADFDIPCIYGVFNDESKIERTIKKYINKHGMGGEKVTYLGDGKYKTSRCCEGDDYDFWTKLLKLNTIS